MSHEANVTSTVSTGAYMNAVRIGTLALVTLVVLLSACASKSVSKTQARVTTAAAVSICF